MTRVLPYSSSRKPFSNWNSPYTKTKSWKEGTDCCWWDGVICDIGTGNVIGLNLSASLLYGTIHSNNSLFSLHHLQKLDLSFNDFNNSQIVSQFGHFSNLTYLSLCSSDFVGRIPLEISYLSKLVFLDLSGNYDLILETTSFKKLVQNITQLQELDLSFVNMSLVAPSSLMNLSSSLAFLKLVSCKLQGKIPGMSHLSKLALLDLSNNHLTLETMTFEKLVQNLSKLREVNLNDVNMSLVAPSSLMNLSSSLASLKLEHCGLQGKIPDKVFQQPNLQLLDLLGNEGLNGSLPRHDWNNSFQSLSLSRTKIQIHLEHDFINNLRSVETLDLSACNFEGSNLELFGRLTQLIELRLSHNNFSGQIPSSLQNLKKLLELDLSHNNFNGQIPSSFENLQQLHVLYLQNNNLSGEVPSTICKLKSLQILDLSNNSLNGVIPQCLGNFSNALSVLHLGMNNFQGTIPEPFSVGCSLRYLNFNGNQLRRRVPLSISNCKILEILDLGNNNIDDTFPHFLETLPELQVLVLQSNKLHGLVKGSSTNYSFSKLRIFDLSNNMFSGPLPADSLTFKGLEIELVKIQTLLTTIDLSSNKFTGIIPQSIGKLKSLKLLNLSHNRLTGNIQPSLGNLNNLESLDLSSNLLVGRIPTQLANMTFLQIFQVSHNRLEGPIPEGKQFNTFDSSSYEGNLGLCGFPLKNCNSEKRQQPTASKEGDSESKIGFGWKPVVAGYGCGVIFGVAMGYVVFKIRKPMWLVRMVEGKRRRKPRRSNN
ncbi:hypothetical protein GH714_012189 [Hevea brasiliensis]|uniref:Leucine-rich repeat-containing N-terminal plant-type domain-containing protein n=1 Tax=Hevea brasiliensis TaxID=3981 RepID=A0A6A6N2A1_HEVBR|nr:hypothetical protein GH714_012189 [Hevea brasiliensis]